VAKLAGVLPLSPAPNDLRVALIHCRGMRELVENNPAHWHDEQALDALRGLCRRAWVVMRDPVCRACLAAIDDHAAALPLDADERSWSPGRLFGAWFLRREVLRKLEMLSERLAELQAARGAPPKDFDRLYAAGPVSRRRERYATALRRAAAAVGGEARLALILRAPREEMARWLSGEEEAPLDAFLASLDLVAAGPFVREAVTVRAATAAAPAAAQSHDEPLRYRTLGPLAAGLALALVGALLVHKPALEQGVSPPPQAKFEASAAPPSTDAPKIAPAAKPRPARARAKTAVAAAPAGVLVAMARTTDRCSLLTGVAALQCLRCDSERGLGWFFCQEKTRLEYCDTHRGDDGVCPSPIPVSPPQ
jgi:hypothetical protein